MREKNTHIEGIGTERWGGKDGRENRRHEDEERRRDAEKQRMTGLKGQYWRRQEKGQGETE